MALRSTWLQKYFLDSLIRKMLIYGGEIIVENSTSTFIFSLGIIAYKIMTGKFPFPDNLSQSELTKKIQEGKFDFSTRVFIDYSERAIDLVKRMLKVDPGRDFKIDAPHFKRFSINHY